jgi:hypothetical protein
MSNSQNRVIVEVHPIGVDAKGRLAYLVLNGKPYSFVVQGVDDQGKLLLKQIAHGNDDKKLPGRGSSG